MDKDMFKENGKNKLEEKYYIDILPPKYIENTIYVIENLGFSLIEVENKYTENKYDNLPFIQCFKFRKLKEALDQNKNDIEIFFKQKNEFIEVYLNQNIKVTFE
ncbi:sporulation protein, partial [Paraclostridium bifermentans]|uniref:sporulation protein n=1 Tax=Paraclostridium bifermentans TaxID=1490 RepID=UPI00374E29C5